MPEGNSQENDGCYYSMKQLTEVKKISLEEPAKMIDTKINALWYPPYEGTYIEKEGMKFYLVNEKKMNEINQLYEKQ